MYESVMPYTEHLEKYIEDKPILFYIENLANKEILLRRNTKKKNRYLFAALIQNK